jgi:hypothetical protein
MVVKTKRVCKVEIPIPFENSFSLEACDYAGDLTRAHPELMLYDRLLHVLRRADSVLDDLHSFDPINMTWTLLSAAEDGARPSARRSHGFTSAGGKLYVHGGYNNGAAQL